MTLISRNSARPAASALPGALPPRGATFASFVLFASLASLLALIYAFGEWWNLSGGFGFPSDAAWIRATLARNVTSGQGLSFNPGVAVAGAPGPAWVALLGVGGLLVPDHVVAAKLVGVLVLVLTACLVWFIALDLLHDWRFAFLSALLTAASPRLMSEALSGTEGALAGLLVAATIHWQGLSWANGARHRRLLAAAAGLAALCRPELLLLLPLLMVDRGLVAAIGRQPGRKLRAAFGRSLVEMLGAAVILLPYLIYNWRVGGPLWQQPEVALRAQPLLAWPKALLSQLWSNNPMGACAAVLGLPVALIAGTRDRAPHATFLPVLFPIVILIAPALIWRQASASNASYAAAYLMPVISLLASAGLFLLYRAVKQPIARRSQVAASICLGVGIAALVGGLGVLAWFAHSAAWRQHGAAVKKVSDLQGHIGQWVYRHLAPDSSIASREVGAIGFYSHRRVVDLGGTIDRRGLSFLRRPGSPDANLLAYLQEARPSHLAIRPGDFPDLAQRADILSPVITCVATDPVSGGVTTMVLYETPWPAPSVRALRER
jgi:hypothetical protein